MPAIDWVSGRIGRVPEDSSSSNNSTGQQQHQLIIHLGIASVFLINSPLFLTGSNSHAKVFFLNYVLFNPKNSVMIAAVATMQKESEFMTSAMDTAKIFICYS